jgi:hypothetical protein
MIGHFIATSNEDEAKEDVSYHRNGLNLAIIRDINLLTLIISKINLLNHGSKHLRYTNPFRRRCIKRVCTAPFCDSSACSERAGMGKD